MYGQRKYVRSSIHQPSLLVDEASINLCLPAMCWSIDNYSLASSGVSEANNAIRSALGEHFERRHFWSGVQEEATGRLADFLDRDEIEEWKNAFRQTGGASEEELDRHIFSLTKVVDFRSGETRFIPTSTIRISPIPGSASDHFYRFHDTSGCCAHTDVNSAITGAILEQIERQSLIFFWITGSRGNIVNKKIATKQLDGHERLLKKLDRNGELFFMEITVPGFPGYTIFTIFKSGNPDSLVKYCPGLSFGMTIKDSIRKSFIELWQNYVFLVSQSGPKEFNPKNIDRYQRNFLDANSVATADEITESIGYSIYKKRDFKPATYQSLVDHIISIAPCSYLYIKRQDLGNIPLYFCKFLSPSFFLHMDNSQSNNIHNHISAPYSHLIRPDRLARMVPFP